MAETYVLDLRETAVAQRVLSEGVRGIEAGRIHHFLTSHGFTPDPTAGVTVTAAGLVVVDLEADPSNVWGSFANEPIPQEATQSVNIERLKAFRTKSREGRATARDRDEILDLVVESMLRAYGQEPE